MNSMTNTNQSMSRTISGRSPIWIIAIICVMCLGYAFSLQIGYVEGDDASSLIYHMMGRDRAVQPPYAPYHGFADLLLTLLPSDQGVLLPVTMFATAVANIIMIVSILALVFQWLNITAPRSQLVISVLTLLALPELFYLGNLYTPALIAMAYILPAHLLLLRAFGQDTPPRVRLSLALAATALFGVGAATRWDMVLYGGVIFIDLIRQGVMRFGLSRAARPALIRHGAYAVLWGAYAILSWIGAIYLSGYIITDILDIAAWSQDWQRGLSLVTLASIQPLLTPFVIATLLIGLVALILRHDSLLIIVGVSLLLVSPWLGTGVPKALLVAFPALIATCIAGVQFIASLPNPTLRRLSLGVGVILILLPWLVGVRLQLGDNAWGPGFDLQPYDRIESPVQSFEIVFFQPGTAVPTTEGPRALFGHAGAIFGSGWRNIVQMQADETAHIIDTALAEDLPLIILRGSGSLYISEIVARGFVTRDPALERQRVFIRPEDEARVILFYPQDDEDILADATLPERVIVTGYPSDLRALYLQSPQQMYSIARIAAVYSTSLE